MYKYRSTKDRLRELSYLLNKKRTNELAELLRRTNPADIVEFMEDLAAEEILVVFRLLKKKMQQKYLPS